MSTLALIAFSSALSGVFLTCTRRWAYVCWAVIIEVSWVGLAVCYGYMAVELDDGSLLFWSIS